MSALVPVLLVRRYGTGTSGTFATATLSTPDGTMPWTGYMLELPWKGNWHRVSCVPAGRYQARFRTPENTPAGLRTGVYELLDVPDRDGILIHVANKAEELLGCLAPGERVGALDNRDGVPVGAVLGSRDVLEGLHRASGKGPMLVIIEWEPNVGEREGEP
jgi:hypothetical protein